MEPTTNKDQLSLSKQMFLALKQAETKLEMMELAKSEPIAIIGIGCRFPGNANTPESFWQLLANGEDGVREIPPERWDIDSHYHPDPDTPGKMYIRHASLVEQVEQFDPEFFGISPREAHSLDPQQRFLLEVTWEALERAGINPQQLENTQTGVFLGIGQNDYADLGLSQLENISPYDGTGNGFCFAAGRLSYFLGLQGPSIAIDTACSASLVAVHEACQSLRQRESNLALAGGVQLILSPYVTTALSRLKALSPDGRCKTFDAAADGYGRGEGCGMVVLKRLSDAVKNGDQIWAVIRGSAVNHDGPSSGLTVPNKLAQEKLIEQALKAAKVEPSQVGYVEAHGTGTSLGDPMEVRALATVFEQGHNQENPLRIGSVKTNIGHLEAAAGIAGLIKVVLQLQHQKIAPSLNFVNPNPYIEWENLPLEVPTQLKPWLSSGDKRVGGVSSFAISGTNAHVVLEEAPREGNRQQATGNSEDYLERSVNLLTLSAKTEIALAELVSSYIYYLETDTELAREHPFRFAIANVCYTANTGRAHFKHRLAVIASDHKELAEKLLYQKTGEEVVGLFAGQFDSASQSPPKIAFLFTGQGSQYVNMGRELYETQPTFRQALEQCDQILQPYLEYSLLEILYPQNAQPSSSSLLDQTAYTQPALFAIEYALYKLWSSWGIKPKAVMGHSVGEYVAATVAGIFSLEDGLKLIATRGRLMQQLPSGGEMVSVMASESKIRELITPYTEKVAIAAINGPESVVISGEAEAIAAIVHKLESDGVKTKRLQVSHAFHSPLMEPILAEFEALAKQITYHQPKIPLISNVTGTKVDNSIATANYWVNHIRQPVKFAASMATLHQQGSEIFLEIGAKPILLGMGRQCLPEDSGTWLPSLRPGVDEWQQILSSLGQLYIRGAQIDWSGFDRDYSPQKVVLPTYPFQRERYWVETAKDWNGKAISATKLHPLINQKFCSPLAKEIFFESHFSTTNLPFLADHRIYEKVVVPGASHISLLLAAASLTLPTTACQLEDILFPQALAIPEQGARTVQVALTPQDSSYSCQVISFDDSLDSQTHELSNNGNQADSWAVHATGKLALTKAEQSLIPLEEIQDRCLTKIDNTEVYQYIWDRQIQLGQSFRWIEQVWLGEGEVLCQMKVPQTVWDATKYQLHPALIDSCFQSIVALDLSQSDDNNETFVPFSVEKFIFYNRPQPGLLWCFTRASQDKQAKERLKADIQLFDQDGQLVAQVIGLQARKANPETLLMTLEADLSNWFYEINWQTQPLPSTSPSNGNQTGNWLVFALTSELTECIGKELAQKGHNCIWVSPGSEYQQLDAQHYQINPTVAEQFSQLLQDNADIKGIVHLWGVDETKESVGELAKAQELGCATALHLVQGLTQAGLTQVVPMWLVTQGTQTVLAETEVVQPQQGSLWGLGRVMRLEHPELTCCRVDLDPKSPVADTLPILVDELLFNNQEDQIAIRQGVRYVARLVQQQKQKFTSQQQLPIPETQPLELKLSEYGLIDNLNWQPMQRRPPEAQEVEIQVKAVGLNFRDVLNALGLLKEYYAQHLGITSVEQLTLGLECVGVITSVGETVSHWQIGDEVMAFVPNGFSSFVTTAAEFVMAKPKQMSFPEAATLPLTFFTAYYGLQHLAKIQPGERVLIHAAAGGVGQAAVQIALQAGAEVFATASPPKWDFLKSLGVQQIMNSRTLDFASEIMHLTQGGGVDIVFNSLNGEFIDKSFAVLATQGRFVEIGKIGIWTPEQVKQKRPDVDYFPFDIGEVMTQQPNLIAKISEELTQQWNQGKLQALPYKVFPSTEVAAAFRYMQQAKHIGKVVVAMPEASCEQKSIQAEASYLITGGLGALGLEVAQWMVKEGARNIVLTGRSAPKEAAQKTIRELETAGASVNVLLGDVSTQEDVTKIFQQMVEASLPPLKGVIHAAGVLDDGVLQKMSWERFTKVMAPKVSGTWYLHQLTQDLPLDFFVCFSSMASMLGNYGQGNYAAANGFMDAIAHYRRGQGLPGLSINWGAWATAGMAARLAREHQNRMQSSGVVAIDPESGMQALGSLLSGSQSQVGVFPVNWPEFFRQMPGMAKLPFLEAFTTKSVEQSQKDRILEQLNVASDREQEKLLTSYLQSRVAHFMGMTLSQIELEKSLTVMGLDSLMAVELRNQIQTELAVDIPATRFMEGITIIALATEIKQQLIIKTDKNQTIESNNQGQLDQNKDSNWIEVEL
ncbi:type I polyketide synthase [Moorena producens JHB]|uniref:Type I polyketide synthase n=1 Tax=Moorena producens (strain JHB) TaxID=1454205 RepID=A0A1D9G7C7_MOOP1|nr:type I polyketide synthase [Moorena producens]AOY83395.1 type I polyketide synthase [Moorena producens JHB]